MKAVKLLVTALVFFAIGTMKCCKMQSAKSPYVSTSIRAALDQAGFKGVSVSQDRDRGIVTLGGQAASANDKLQAESLAKSLTERRSSRTRLP